MFDNSYNNHEGGRNQGLMERPETLHRLYDCKGHGRKYRRFELEFPVHLKFQSDSTGKNVEGVSKNVSVGGLMVRLPLPIPENTVVTFFLSVHGKQSVRPVHFRGEGEIVRVERGESASTFLMAVKCKTPITHLKEYLPM